MAAAVHIARTGHVPIDSTWTRLLQGLGLCLLSSVKRMALLFCASMLGRYCKRLAGGVGPVSGSCGLLLLFLPVSQECSPLSETIGLRNGHSSRSLVVGNTLHKCRICLGVASERRQRRPRWKPVLGFGFQVGVLVRKVVGSLRGGDFLQEEGHWVSALRLLYSPTSFPVCFFANLGRRAT